jgi:hypothetical protein
MIRDMDAGVGGDPTTGTADGTGFRSDFRPDDRITTTGRMASERCATDTRTSIADLLKNLRDETTALVRQEIALAKTEMNEKAAKAARNAGYMAAGGVLAHAGVFVILLGLSALLYWGLVEAGLSHYVSGWLAPLIVGVVVAVIGYALIQKAISAFKHETLVPEKTVDSLKENQQWLSHKATA